MRVDHHLVLKYCEALDEFVRIRVFGEEEGRHIIGGAANANKSAFQHAVVKACVLDHNADLTTRIERAQRHTSQDLNEILYILCVEVNPSFEIHQVSVPLGDATSGATTDGSIDSTPKLTDEQLDKLMHLDVDLKKRVIGQDHAVDVVSRAIKKAGVGLRDPRRPVGSFLFVGHVGVGKTELAKAIAESMYGSQSRLIRVDCSEYALPHEYAKLIGAPPGYIGHNEGGYLTEAAKEMGDFVVLFDEIEKAHSKMHNILLQLLDEGTVTDSKGFKVSFKNAVVLMTSNLGVREVEQSRSTIGFDCEQKKAASFESMKTEINEALKKCFRPEMLNRIDDVIVFNTLGKEDSLKIADIMLGDLAKIARRAGVAVEFGSSVRRHIVETGWRREWGARELKRTIKREVETPLTDLILDRTIRQGASVKIEVENGVVSFSPTVGAATATQTV